MHDSRAIFDWFKYAGMTNVNDLQKKEKERKD